ncbi:MAG: biopolymer transport protein ExbB [Chthoniobacter sp.]|jgi:biopolymer transport protein ExbB|nr:biopolymer transport protein ExbB [Chthoniobacter sp.]
MRSTHYRRLCLAPLAVLLALAMPAHAWWNAEWTIRKKITIDPGAEARITEPIGWAVVLLRLHEGNFAFASAKEDGSDLRFIAADDKTLLPYHLEKIDPLLNEAFVWVKVPEIKPGAPTTFWMYYGSNSPIATTDAKATYDADTVLVYHFAEHGSAASDSTTNANNAQNPATASDGTIIGTGLRLDGKTTVKLPESASLTWSEGSPITWSAWVKPAVLQPRAVLFSRREGGNAVLIGVDNGVPFFEVTNPAGTQRSPAGEPLAAGVWRQLAVVFSGPKAALFLDGTSYATLDAALPAMKSAALLGGDVPEGSPDGAPAVAGFSGELDELQISKVARTPSALKFAAVCEGTTEQATKLIAMGNDEESGHGGAEGELAKHLSLISDISKSLTFDGWAVIFLCTVLAIVGWVVTVMKVLYLNKIGKATDAFLKEWKHLAADLGSLDHGDAQSVKSLGGKASSKVQKVMRPSPLYHIYQIGSSEIQHRLSNAREGFVGLSGRSMQAIRATLDGGLVREVQRLNSQLVFLTIGIAGGPYLGLLGTVIGVMITFAVIAKSGAVEVNSIAPGIAGALLATVAGLAVAIPALFAYSYISSRIKDAISEMQIFIDEFVAKIAEAFPSGD